MPGAFKFRLVLCSICTIVLHVGLGLIVSTSLFSSNVDHLLIGEGKERIEYLFYYNKYISLLISR